MAGDWRKGDCAGCRQRMFVNVESGLCVTCENGKLKQDVSHLKTQLEQARKETAFYQNELTEHRNELTEVLKELRK